MRYRLTAPLGRRLAEFIQHETVQECLHHFPGSVIMTPAETDLSKEPRTMIDKTQTEERALDAVIPELGACMEGFFGSADGTVYDFGLLEPEQMRDVIACIMFTYIGALPEEKRVTADQLHDMVDLHQDACISAIGDYLTGVFGDADGTVYDMGALSGDQLFELVERVVDTFQEAVHACAAVRTQQVAQAAKSNRLGEYLNDEIPY